MSADPELRPPSEPSNFSFAEGETAPANSLHGVISTPLPCPFCGEEPEQREWYEGLAHPMRRREIKCKKCKAKIEADYEEAIARWNRRAPRPLTSMEEFIVGFANYVQAELKKRGIG